MNELLGFAVLTSPLWLFLILIPIAIWFAVVVARRVNRLTAKALVGIAAFALFLSVPLADEIAGAIYFSYLCSTKTTVKVYHSVPLPADYWDETGSAKFYDATNGNFYLKEYRVNYKAGTYSSFFHIDHAGYARVNGETGQILGEVVDFRYWGGWLRRNMTPHNSATACDGRMERSNSLVKQIFVQKKDH